eukprot:1082000-Amphidinium_carterae.1
MVQNINVWVLGGSGVRDAMALWRAPWEHAKIQAPREFHAIGFDSEKCAVIFETRCHLSMRHGYSQSQRLV